MGVYTFDMKEYDVLHYMVDHYTSTYLTTVLRFAVIHADINLIKHCLYLGGDVSCLHDNVLSRLNDTSPEYLDFLRSIGVKDLPTLTQS